MNSDSTITKILPARKDKDAPGALSAELVQAQAEFEQKRKNIVKRGVDRVNSIAKLQQELAVEQQNLQEVLDAAKQ